MFTALFLQSGKITGGDVLWPSDSCIAAHPCESKGFDTDRKAIYNEDWTYRETTVSNYDDADLTETLLFEEGESVFKLKRRHAKF